MNIELQVDPPFAATVDSAQIDRAVQAAVEYLRPNLPPSTSVAISITDDETVRSLNAQYRGIDAPTDVLSFENAPDPDFPAPDNVIAQHLGDIIIACPVAEKQARLAGHTVLDEMTLLTVHGMLHLLGLDHDTAAHKAAMWQAQREILARLGLPHVQPTEQ